MKKLAIALLGLAGAFCFSMAVGNVNNVETSASTENGATVALSNTVYKVSESGKKMLMVTAVENYENVYEIGYDFVGYTVTESDTAESGKYYESLTTGGQTEYAKDIFGADWEGAGLLVWEVAYTEGVSFTAYAKEGVIKDGYLVKPETEIKVTGTQRSNAKYTVIFKNDNGDVLQNTEVFNGKMPKYEAETPTKAADSNYTYTFKGWDKEFEPVTGEVVYTAVYEATAVTPAVPTEDKTLVDSSNLMANLTATCPVGGSLFQVGNLTGAQLSSHAAYGIKLPSSSEHAGYEGAMATIVINVGDVSAYDHLEMKFWGLGINGDTWTLAVPGTNVSVTESSWHYSTTAIIVDIPVSAVQDGKLTVTFKQTGSWAGDELYIQYIKAIAPEQAPEVPTEDKVLVNTTNVIAKTTLVDGFATIGNITGNVSGHGDYGIQFTTGYDHGKSGTLAIEVGNVSGYEKVEVTLWMLGIGGGGGTITVGGVENQYHSWDYYSATPLVVEVPVEAIEDGKLIISVTTQYRGGDELYIQSIKAIAPAQA